VEPEGRIHENSVFGWYSRFGFGIIEGMGQVDGNVPDGWRFDMFVIDDDVDQYQR